MKIGGLEFRDLGEVVLLKDRSGLPERLRPQDRFTNPNGLSLHKHGDFEFCKFSVPNLPKGPGVYAFVSGTEVFYIGKASAISKRFMPGYRLVSPRMCFSGGPETTCRINAEVLSKTVQGFPIHVMVFETDDFGTVEAELLKQISPPWNRSGVLV